MSSAHGFAEVIRKLDGPSLGGNLGGLGRVVGVAFVQPRGIAVPIRTVAVCSVAGAHRRLRRVRALVAMRQTGIISIGPVEPGAGERSQPPEAPPREPPRDF